MSLMPGLPEIIKTAVLEFGLVMRPILVGILETSTVSKVRKSRVLVEPLEWWVSEELGEPLRGFWLEASPCSCRAIWKGETRVEREVSELRILNNFFN